MRIPIQVSELHISENLNESRSGDMLGVTCNICNGMWFGVVQTRLLCRFYCKKNFHEAFTVPYYLPVEKLFIDTLEFHIVDENGSLASLADTVKVEVTLHFIHNVSPIHSRRLRLD